MTNCELGIVIPDASSSRSRLRRGGLRSVAPVGDPGYWCRSLSPACSAAKSGGGGGISAAALVLCLSGSERIRLPAQQVTAGDPIPAQFLAEQAVAWGELAIEPAASFHGPSGSSGAEDHAANKGVEPGPGQKRLLVGVQTKHGDPASADAALNGKQVRACFPSEIVEAPVFGLRTVKYTGRLVPGLIGTGAGSIAEPRLMPLVRGAGAG